MRICKLRPGQATQQVSDKPTTTTTTTTTKKLRTKIENKNQKETQEK
jgi:hypothetical protein